MQNKGLFELNGLHTNSSQAAAEPSLILKCWLGLREVEDWELKLDAEEELQLALDFLFSFFNISMFYSPLKSIKYFVLDL